MATAITGGFVIDGDVAEATAVDSEPRSAEEELAHRVISASRRGQRHAAFAAAKELLLTVAREHGLTVTIID